MKTPPKGPIRLQISSAPSQLPVVRAAVEKMCELVGFDVESAGGITLSVDEALTNIIRHAYDGAEDKPIEIELLPRSGPRGIQISLRDYGRQVDPSRIKPRDLSDIKPGGLGVHIMQHCLDHVQYTRPTGGGTLLTLVKNILPKKENDKV